MRKSNQSKEWKRKDTRPIRYNDCPATAIAIKKMKTNDTEICENKNDEDACRIPSIVDSHSIGKTNPMTRENLTTGSTIIQKKIDKKKQKQKKKKTTKKELDPQLIKIKLKERINVLSPSEKQTFEIEWNTFAVAESDEKAIAEKIVVEGKYGPMDEEEIKKVLDDTKITQINLWQAISLRSAYLQQKAMYRHAQLKRHAKKAHNQYTKGCTVLDLAKQLDQPPMNVFRIILSQMGWSKARIKVALRDPKKFDTRERAEFLAAETSDVVSMVSQAKISTNAEKFEDILSFWLEKKGIQFVRQKQLESEQKKEFGTAKVTPDFLLLDSVFINGLPCHWIDCKAFYGANLQFSIKKTRKQMRRYVDHWGPGAIVYLQGFSEIIRIPNCALLNAYGTLDDQILSELEKKNCAALNGVNRTLFQNTEKK